LASDGDFYIFNGGGMAIVKMVMQLVQRFTDKVETELENETCRGKKINKDGG